MCDTTRWAAHDDPDRALECGAVFCGCLVCETVLSTAALCDPELPIAIRFGRASRLVIEAGVLVADGVSERDLLRRFGEPGDWIREVRVANSRDRHALA